MPLELQRRIVNGALGQHDLAQLIWLSALYAAVAVVQGSSKLMLNIYRSKVGERTSRRLRLQTDAAALDDPQRGSVAGNQGVGLSIILSEVEPVGGFVGTGISEPVLHLGVLISVFAYMTYLQPWMAAIAAALFAPQFVFVPLLQEAINRRTERRIRVLRALSVEIVNEAAAAAPPAERQDFIARVGDVYRLNMQIYRRKYSMNFLMNLLHHLGIGGVLLAGGLLLVHGHTDVGTIVAFISGLNQVRDPWGDVVNYFRDMTNARVKYKLIASALNQRDPELERRAIADAED